MQRPPVPTAARACWAPRQCTSMGAERDLLSSLWVSTEHPPPALPGRRRGVEWGGSLPSNWEEEEEEGEETGSRLLKLPVSEHNSHLRPRVTAQRGGLHFRSEGVMFELDLKDSLRGVGSPGRGWVCVNKGMEDRKSPCCL